MIEQQHLPVKKHRLIYSKQQTQYFNKVDACQQYFTSQSYKDYNPDIKKEFVKDYYKEHRTPSNNNNKSSEKLKSLESESDLKSNTQLNSNRESNSNLHNILNLVRVKQKPPEFKKFLVNHGFSERQSTCLSGSRPQKFSLAQSQIFRENQDQKPNIWNIQQTMSCKNSIKVSKNTTNFFNSLASSNTKNPQQQQPKTPKQSDSQIRISQFLQNQQQSPKNSLINNWSSSQKPQNKMSDFAKQYTQKPSQFQKQDSEIRQEFQTQRGNSSSSYRTLKQQQQSKIRKPQTQQIKKRKQFYKVQQQSNNNTNNQSDSFHNLQILQSNQLDDCEDNIDNSQRYSTYIKYLKSMDSIEQAQMSPQSIEKKFLENEKSLKHIPSYDFYREKLQSQETQKRKPTQKPSTAIFKSHSPTHKSFQNSQSQFFQNKNTNQQQQQGDSLKQILSNYKKEYNRKNFNNFSIQQSEKLEKETNIQQQQDNNNKKQVNPLFLKPVRVKSPNAKMSSKVEKIIKLKPYDLSHNNKENELNFDNIKENQTSTQHQHSESKHKGKVLKVFFEDFAYGLKTIDQLKQSKVKSKNSLRRLFGFNDEISSVILTSEAHEKNFQQQPFTSDDLKHTFFEEVFNQFEHFKANLNLNEKELQYVKVNVQNGQKEVPAEFLWDQYKKLTQMHDIVIDYLDGKEKTKLTKAKQKILSEIVAVHTREKFYSNKGKKKMDINTKQLREIQKDLEQQHSTTRNLISQRNLTTQNNNTDQ